MSRRYGRDTVTGAVHGASPRRYGTGTIQDAVHARHSSAVADHRAPGVEPGTQTTETEKVKTTYTRWFLIGLAGVLIISWLTPVNEWMLHGLMSLRGVDVEVDYEWPGYTPQLSDVGLAVVTLLLALAIGALLAGLLGKPKVIKTSEGTTAPAQPVATTTAPAAPAPSKRRRGFGRFRDEVAAHRQYHAARKAGRTP